MVMNSIEEAEVVVAHRKALMRYMAAIPAVAILILLIAVSFFLSRNIIPGINNIYLTGILLLLLLAVLKFMNDIWKCPRCRRPLPYNAFKSHCTTCGVKLRD